MFNLLEEIFEGLNNSEKDIRAVVLTSNGKHFTAGFRSQISCDYWIDWIFS